MRVLVTGGAGFIGSALVRHLVLDRHHDVLTVDKLTYAGTLTSLKPVIGRRNYIFVKADICDRRAMQRVFGEFRPDLVMHLAAETHVDRSITDPGRFMRTNIVGTFTLLEAARAYWAGLPALAREGFRFLQVSTDEVFGSLGPEGLFSETSPYDPRSPYSASKGSADHLARAWWHTYGLPVIVTNCSNNYGPFQFPEKLVPLTILTALDGRPIPIYGRGDNVRDWLFVDDHVRALSLIAEQGRPGGSYNVGGHNERSNIEVVRTICRLLDEMRPAYAPHDALIAFVPDRPGHDARYAIDATRLTAELGWRPEESFETGIARTVRWYLDNDWWWKPLHRRYRLHRLGLEPAGAAR